MSFLLPEKVTLLSRVDKEFSDIFDKQILYKNNDENREKYKATNRVITVYEGKESFKGRDSYDNGMIYASFKYFFAKVGNDHIIGSKIPFRDGWVGPTDCIVFKIYAKVSINDDDILIANKIEDGKYYKACEFKNYPNNQYYLTKITQTGGKKQRKSMKSKKSRKIKNKKSRKSYSE